MWVSYAQRNLWAGGVVTVRARDNAITALAALRRELAALDPGIAIRVALGAHRGDVMSLVMRVTLPMVGAGVGIGLAAAFGLARFARSMLYEAPGVDPVTYAVVGLLLALVALGAAAIPARRASRVDPMLALRVE